MAAPAINSYFNKFELLAPNQFRFRLNSFTSHAVRQLYDALVEYLNGKKSTCGIFLDLKRAFDAIKYFVAKIRKVWYLRSAFAASCKQS